MYDITDPIYVFPDNTFTVDESPSEPWLAEKLERCNDYKKFESLQSLIEALDKAEAQRVELVDRLNHLNTTLNIALTYVNDQEKWEGLVAKQSLAMNRSDLNDYDLGTEDTDNHFSRNVSWLRIRCRELEKALLDTVSLNENTNSIAREVIHKCPSVRG